jgi:hypothetical protein
MMAETEPTATTKAAAVAAAASAKSAAAARIDEAATDAFELIQKYANVSDPHALEQDNPWQDPHQMFDELRKARTRLTAAWAQLLQAQQKQVVSSSSDNTENTTNGKVSSEQDFRALYMDMITDAFGDVLEDLRNGEEELNVDVLVDCLQSGVELMSAEDREGFFGGFEDDAVEMELEDPKQQQQQQLTPHEMRRRELGFDIPEQISL